jgi:hypothetical protein
MPTHLGVSACKHARSPWFWNGSSSVGAAVYQYPHMAGMTPTLDDVCSEDVEHLLVCRQRPEVVGHNGFQRVGCGTDRIHLRQQALRVRGFPCG